MGWSGLHVPTVQSAHRWSFGCGVFTADCVEFTEDIFLLSSSQFRDMCSVPTVDAPLPGMEKVNYSIKIENGIYFKLLINNFRGCITR